MGVNKPYKFIGFGAMDVKKPHKFIGFGAMDVTNPYKFVGFGGRIFLVPLVCDPSGKDCTLRPRGGL